MGKFRHYRERFDPRGTYVLRRRVRFADGVVLNRGDSLPPEIFGNMKLLRRFWDRELIEHDKGVTECDKRMDAIVDTLRSWEGRVHASGVPFVNDFSKVVGFPVKMGQLFEARKRI